MKVFGKHLTIILKKMCDLINVDYDTICFRDNEWYKLYRWDEEKQNEFIEWLKNYFYNNKEARQELMRTNFKTKKHCQKAADEFVWNFGWTTSVVKDKV